MKDEEQIRINEKPDADPRIDLAIERTRLALERTQLAWIRTIIGMITAGIAIDKGLQLLHEARLITGDAWLKSGHFAGLVFSLIGTLLMIIATIFYMIRAVELSQMMKRKIRLFDPAAILSLFISVIGILVVYFLFRDK